MKFKKIFPYFLRCAVLFLLSAVILGAFTGCGLIIINTQKGTGTDATTVPPETESPSVTTDGTATEPPSPETTSPPETQTPVTPVVFPDRIGEAEARLEALSSPIAISDFDLILASASNTADVVFCDEDSPLYRARTKRNSMLYEKFEVNIRTIYESVDSEKLYSDLLLAVQAGENPEIYLDLVIIPANEVGRFTAKGLVKDMRSLPFYAINSGSKSGNVGSSRYADLGDGTDAPEYIYALYFNRTVLGKDASAKLYADAEEGALTFESLLTVSKEMSPHIADIGVGDGAPLLGDLAVTLSGISYIKKDGEGVPKLEISESELLQVDSLIESVTKFKVYQPAADAAPAIDRFKNGEIPFYLGTLSDMLELYDEKTEWGLLPLPSEKDIGAISEKRPALCLAATGARLEQTSIWLLGFNAASGDWIRDDFLQTSIEKYLRDNSSCLSLAKILSQKTELGFERVFAGYYDGLADATFGGVGEALSGNIRYSDIYAKNLSAINKKLAKLP